jgi:plasmid stabilization system protein ParE
VRLELHPEARAELRRAALWYDEQRPGLGDEFLSEISASLDRVSDAPESYPHGRARRPEGPLIRKTSRKGIVTIKIEAVQCAAESGRILSWLHRLRNERRGVSKLLGEQHDRAFVVRESADVVVPRRRLIEYKIQAGRFHGCMGQIGPRQNGFVAKRRDVLVSPVPDLSVVSIG